MPESRVAKRLFGRVLVWQPASGTIIDLPSRAVHSNGSISKDESRVNVASGSTRAANRTRQAAIPVTRNEHQVIAKVLRRTQCPVKAAFLGLPETESYMWLEPTRINLDSPEPDGGFAYKSIVLENSIFYPGIWRGEDLLRGVPWQGTKDWKDPDDGSVQLRPEGNVRLGYEGPAWTIAASTTQGRRVGLNGASTGLSATNPAITRIEFPAWGAKVSLEAPPGFSVNDGAIRVLDWDETVMDSDSSGEGATLTIPQDAFYLEVQVSNTEARPRLRVKNIGEPEARVYPGGVTPDCSKVSEPDWPELPNPNQPPVWKSKERITTEKASEPPVWENRQDLSLGALAPDNTAPTWDDKEKLEAANSLLPADQPPTWENRDDLYTGGEVDYDRGVQHYTPQDTLEVYSHVGGLSSFDYPNGTNYNIINDDIADGQIKVDGAEDKTFIARNDGIYLLETSSYILDTSGNSNKRVRGLALDPIQKNVFFTYNETYGVFYTSYDGSSGENQLTSSIIESYYLAFEPNKEYVFAASRVQNEIVRFDAYSSSVNKTVVVDGSGIFGEVYETVKVCTSLEVIVWQRDDASEIQILRSNYDGSNTLGLQSTYASIEIDPYRIAVADKERVLITVSNVEGGYSSVTFYTVTSTEDGGPVPSNFNINNADTGKRVATKNSYTIDNTAPSFENKASLEYDPSS